MNSTSSESYSTSSEEVEETNEFMNKDFVSLCQNHTYIPSILPAVKRIIVLADIHGDYKLAIKLLEIGRVIKHENNKIVWTGGDTYVVQVGDQVDRCRPKSLNNLSCDNPDATKNDEASDIKILRLFNDLHEQASLQGGKVISLLGNHELMNANGTMDYVSYKGLEEFSNYVDPKNPHKKFLSGKDARKYAFAPGNEYGILLGCTRLSCVIIGSNLFVHAGLIDKILDELHIKKPKDLEHINILVRKWLVGLINKEYVAHIVNSDENSMFWTRILGSIPPNISNEDPICSKYLDRVLKMFNLGSIIIGHTPQSFQFQKGINATCGNIIHRVDNGSSSAFDGYDDILKISGSININRAPQVLEILDDKKYNILTY
ncbi:MAG: metallophosphatase/phosphoesterase [Hyperionvirus sp.]|uniref:Metallophosphatase/phosphoesterase n=1 Tax=Hyperionvirus sp. TaxID=2487770 RepID=A0A3G5AC86_9VIRU|nr:MAG: metallophosphatase/phosphoesterase [Hyperionvirus sp.]